MNEKVIVPEDLAFPCTRNWSGAVGLSKREYFAAKAMEAVLSGRKLAIEQNPPKNVVLCAVEYADALIEALDAQG